MAKILSGSYDLACIPGSGSALNNFPDHFAGHKFHLPGETN